MIELTYSLPAVQQAAKALLAQLPETNCIAFHGGMGAGKTTFITALCRQLGVQGAIGSPTYSIINHYKTTDGKNICHMDWYRLKDEDEAIGAGVEDALYSGDLCFVEWPGVAPGLLPGNSLHLEIGYLGEEERKISSLFFQR